MVTEDLLLGIDLGTSRCKVLLITPGGVERATVGRDTPWSPVETGAELDPDVLESTVLEIVADARTRAGGGRIRALAITAIGQTGVLVGPDGRPLTPMVIWHDTRAANEARALGETIGTRRFSEITGLPLSPFFAPSMYRWFVDHEPRAREGVRWLGMAEWLAYRLGGGQVAEWSLASQSGFLDSFAGTWSLEILEWSGGPQTLLPDLVPAGAAIGTVRPEYPSLAGATIAIGGHDHPCAAVGALATAAGDLYDSCGTAETIVKGTGEVADRVAAVESVLSDELMVGRHVLDGRLTVTGSIPTGRFLGGVLRALGVDPVAAGDLDREALDLPSPEPLEGIRVRNDAQFDFDAIATSAPPAVVWRRALETAATEGARVAAAIARHAGTPERIVVGGGWSRNRAFCAVKARVSPSPMIAPSDEPGARGAALLAGLAAGVYRDVAEFPAPG